MKKLTKAARINIYVFGILANLIPIIGLFVTDIAQDGGLSEMHQYQMIAWIAGGVYYVFMYAVAIIAWRKLKNKSEELDKKAEDLNADNQELARRILILEEEIKGMKLEPQVEIDEDLVNEA